MAAKSGVVDTTVFKGVADLHAEVLSNDSVVAPAHEVVHDGDLIADVSMPIHADATPDHGVDTAATATDDVSVGDTGHVHADLAYADGDHAYADADHGYADPAVADHVVADMDHPYADHLVADADHGYADHSYADAIIPDSAFSEHSMMPADDGTPHSLGADAAKGQGDGHDAAAWWWVGGAAVVAGGLGYWAGDDHHDDHSSSSSSASPDVHVVVESTGAYIDTNGDGVHQTTETDVADFSHGGNADLGADSVTIHFNDIPTTAIDITGFSADDKIEFHMEAMMGNNEGNHQVFDTHASYLANLTISSGVSTGVYYYVHASNNTQGYDSIDLQQYRSSPHDSSSNLIVDAYYIDIGHNGNSADEVAIAYWTDAGNALNHNAQVLPTWNSATSNTNAVLASLNANNEGGVVDFIWPSTPLNV